MENMLYFGQCVFGHFELLVYLDNVYLDNVLDRLDQYLDNVYLDNVYLINMLSTFL